MAMNAGICNFKSFMFGKPEEINFDHDINFGDYSGAWSGGALTGNPDNTNAHDLCSLGYPKSELTDIYENRHNWHFDIYACRLLSDSNVKALNKSQNFAGLDLKIWKMIWALNTCTNRVMDTTIHRDYGLFNDKLMVVRATIIWELNMICGASTVITEVDECIDGIDQGWGSSTPPWAE
tara:strand:- start:16319 stop:16855 length:537 start_codon:yes stop_codon:yes gene_type:complete